MKTQRPKILGREFWLLSLPLLLLGGVALLREAVPNLSDLNPNPLRIQVDSVEQVKPSPDDKDADTTVLIKFRIVGIAPLTNRKDWIWAEDIHLVAVKEGKIRAVPWWGHNDPSDAVLIGSRLISSDLTAEPEWTLCLRDIPREWGDLELRGRIAFGPGITPLPPGFSTKVEDIEKTGKGIIRSVKIPVKRPDK